MRARTGAPSSSAFCADISTTAAPASFMPEALPAVTVPSGLNTGFSLPSPSIEASGRTCSSRVNSVGPFFDLSSTGRSLVEQALLLRARRALVRLDRELVLRLAADVVRLGQVLRGDAHVDVVEGVGEPAHDRVDDLGVAHARSPARVRHPVGAAAHRLRAAGDGDVGLAGRDRLGGGDDRLHARPAQPVDRERGHLLGDARLHRHDPRHVHVLGRRVDHVPEHDLVDLVRLDPGALERRLDGGRAQIGGGDVLQVRRSGRQPCARPM